MEWITFNVGGKCDKHCDKHCDEFFRDKKSQCWTNDVNILTEDGFKKPAEFKVGDFVISEKGNVEIVEIIVQTVNKAKMVNVHGIILTKGHPIRYMNEWIRPYEKFEVFESKDVTLYNFVLREIHSVYLNKNGIDLLVATLGKFEKAWKKT